MIHEGDRCPLDGGQTRIGRSIVVGHIYQLGRGIPSRSKPTFKEEDGVRQAYRMGSYGIGITRILAAAVEQYHDEDGSCWPKLIAPFEVVVILATHDDEATVAEADRIYDGLRDAGIEVALDDRDPRAGVKFADADSDRLSGPGHGGHPGHRQQHGRPQAAEPPGSGAPLRSAGPCRR